MGLIEDAWSAAADIEEATRLDRQLAAMKEQGHDVCQLCGEEIPVYEDDGHEDVLQRLIDHAEAAEDHVNDPQQGWVLAEDVVEGLASHEVSHIAKAARSVRNQFFALFVGWSVIVGAAMALGYWSPLALQTQLLTVALGVLLAFIALSGMVVTHVYGGA